MGDLVSSFVNVGSLFVLAVLAFLVLRKFMVTPRSVRLLGHSWKFPMSQTDASECIRYEIQRSRRYNRSFSIIMVDLNALDKANGIELYRREQFLASLFRRTDFGIFGYGEMKSIFVCPETDVNGARAFIGRIQQASREEFGMGMNCAFASFPDDAITSEGLLEHAAGHLSSLATQYTTEKLST